VPKSYIYEVTGRQSEVVARYPTRAEAEDYAIVKAVPEGGVRNSALPSTACMATNRWQTFWASRRCVMCTSASPDGGVAIRQAVRPGSWNSYRLTPTYSPTS
jgi:hypothetical protein